VRSLPCICTLSLHATSVLFFFLCSRHPRDLHSFPTRRSSDLSTSLRGAHTPIYASPQQVRGEKSDPRDDVHALGVIWYQLLTGDLGAEAPSGRVWPRRLQERGVSEAMVEVLAACFEPRVEDRLASAAELAERLATLAPTTPPLTVIPVSLPPPLPATDDLAAQMQQALQ